MNIFCFNLCTSDDATPMWRTSKFPPLNALRCKGRFLEKNQLPKLLVFYVDEITGRSNRFPHIQHNFMDLTLLTHGIIYCMTCKLIKGFL